MHEEHKQQEENMPEKLPEQEELPVGFKDKLALVLASASIILPILAVFIGVTALAVWLLLHIF
ncbi:MAG TPA: hypothetical protein DCZ20_00670 [Lachnospiraceae bacterium]|nr:hypothetical protein [Lachnospiraceae bacterium]